jgi:hypothetical protein
MVKLQSPIRRKTGTSLIAEGFVQPPKADSELGSSRPIKIREVVPELSSRDQARRTYSKMLNGDAAVDTSVRIWKTPVLGADYFMEAASEDQVDADISEFCSYNIFNNPNSPWLQTLQHILHFCEEGFTVIHPVPTTAEWGPRRSRANRKKYTMLRKLAPRPTSTVKEIEYDDQGGPVGIVQNSINAKAEVEEVKIPIDQLIIFTLNADGGDLEGKSILRTAYPHWYYKTHLYKIDAIQKERHGIGVPDVGLPANYTPADLEAAWVLVQNLRTNERAGIVRPPGFEVGFAEVQGNQVDALASADHHNAMIMLNVMAQFLLLGMSEGGGRATAASQQDVFMKSLRYVADLICSYFNLYLIPRLVGWNFDTDRYPQMKARNIGETKDLQQLGAALANVVDKSIITNDLPLEQWARDQFGAPRKVGERPAEQGVQDNPDNISGPGNNDNTSTVGNNGGQGNMEKGNSPG